MRPSALRVAHRYLRTRQADWAPGMIIPEGYDTGTVEIPGEPYPGEGSQTPPPRDENGRILADEDAEFLMERTAASEISLSELPGSQQRLVQIMPTKPDGVWFGIHGYIVHFKAGMVDRLGKDTLKKLASHPDFRWIEASRSGGFSIGM